MVWVAAHKDGRMPNPITSSLLTFCRLCAARCSREAQIFGVPLRNSRLLVRLVWPVVADPKLPAREHIGLKRGLARIESQIYLAERL